MPKGFWQVLVPFSGHDIGFFDITQPNDNRRSGAIDTTYPGYLVATLQIVALVDANVIDPKRSFLTKSTKPTQRSKQIVCHPESFDAVNGDASTLGRGSPAVRKCLEALTGAFAATAPFAVWIDLRWMIPIGPLNGIIRVQGDPTQVARYGIFKLAWKQMHQSNLVLRRVQRCRSTNIGLELLAVAIWRWNEL